MIVASIGAVAWLFATGQALTVDGLFLVLVALLTAAVFWLYVKFLIRRAMDAAAESAKAGAAKPAATPVAQA